MQLPNTSIDFDRHCEYMIEQSKSAENKLSTILAWVLLLSLTVMMYDLSFFWIPILVMILTVCFRFGLTKYCDMYFNSRQAQTFRYEFNSIKRELADAVASIERNMPQSVSLNDMVALRRDPSSIFLKLLNMSYDTNTKEYFMKLIDIESRLNHSFATHINEIPKSIRNLSFPRLMKALRVEKTEKISMVYPVYTFECYNEKEILIDKIDIALNVELIKKIIEHIDSKINMSYVPKKVF